MAVDGFIRKAPVPVSSSIFIKKLGTTLSSRPSDDVSLRRSCSDDRPKEEVTLSGLLAPTLSAPTRGLASATAGSAASWSGHPRGYRETTMSTVIQKIHLHRTDLIKQARFHEISHPFKFEDLVVFSRLIQSHTQRGPASADVGDVDPNG